MSIVRSLRATLASATLKVTKVKINIGLERPLQIYEENEKKTRWNIKQEKKR